MYSDEEPHNGSQYELLPSHEGDKAGWRVRRRWYQRTRPSWLLFGTAVLFFGSAVLYTVDMFTPSPRGMSAAASKYFNSVITHLWPIGNATRTDNWENENSKSMHSLFDCLANGGCSENQTSVVLLSSFHFANAISGHVSGEDIWAAGVLAALQEMGYTAIYAPSNYELARTYRQYPDLVKAIITEGADAQRCFDDPQCIKTPTHPLGIPAWKMFSMHFWRGKSHPLGNAWTLSPENYPFFDPGESGDNFYLGYSIERSCREIPITPPEERPRQAYVFAKRLSYFFKNDYAWPNVSLVPPADLDITLVGGIGDDTPDHPPVPEGIHNLGVLPKHQFYEELGRSRALVGVGLPFWSPSPYDALCMGVPFINPILHWDEDHPEDRHRWGSQHDGLKFEDPPYVYNVRHNDPEALWKAIHDALDNPIDRYIPQAMTMESLKLRLGNLVEADWRSKAEAVWRHRNETGEGKLFEL